MIEIKISKDELKTMQKCVEYAKEKATSKELKKILKMERDLKEVEKYYIEETKEKYIPKSNVLEIDFVNKKVIG